MKKLLHKQYYKLKNSEEGYILTYWTDGGKIITEEVVTKWSNGHYNFKGIDRIKEDTYNATLY